MFTPRRASLKRADLSHLIKCDKPRPHVPGLFLFRQMNGQDIDAGRHEKPHGQSDHAGAAGYIDQAVSGRGRKYMQFLVERPVGRDGLPVEPGQAYLAAMCMARQHEVIGKIVRHIQRGIRIVGQQDDRRVFGQVGPKREVLTALPR